MEWRKVIWSDVYYVSDVGEVKRVYSKREKIIKKYFAKGYSYVTLRVKPYKSKHFPIHRLVAQAFIANPENKPEVNHINKKRSDNRVENLEWLTKDEHKLHTHKTPLISENRVPVYCYSRYGDFIKRYDSLLSTELDGFTPTAVGGCCRGEDISHKSLIWSFSELPKEYFDGLKIRYEYNEKKVYQYTIYGELINIHQSATIAASGKPIVSIINCCNKKKRYKTAHGYIWSYEELPAEHFTEGVASGSTRQRPIIKIDKGGNKTKYDSVYEAMRFGYVGSAIRFCLSGKFKQHRGFTWKYETPTQF